MIHGLNCTIISKKDGKVEIEMEKQKLMIPAKFLPSSATAGQTFQVYFFNTEKGVLTEKKLAQTILEEILNGE